MIRQFVFDLGTTQSYGAEDYFPSASNAAAYGRLMGADPLALRLLLCGPEGSGKTHLAQVWARQVGAQVLPAGDLDGRLAQIAAGPVVIEDAPRIAGDMPAQEALFHLWNRTQGRGLLITGRGLLPDWGLSLPDLISRLQSMDVAQLDPPDESLLAAVLVKLFADRQLHVQPSLIAYLVPRMERSIGAARQIVGQLDARALALGKPVTRALAAEILEGPFGHSEDMDSDRAE